MPVIRFGVIKTDKEWAVIHRIMSLKNVGKKRKLSYRYFIDSELRKFLRTFAADCANSQNSTRVKKTFDLTLSEDDFIKLNCLADSLKIPIGSLIGRVTLDPHLVNEILSKQTGQTE